MKITKVESLAIKIPRDWAAARGTAGSPAPLVEAKEDYRWAASYPTLYSTKIETALIKIETDSDIVGWASRRLRLRRRWCGRSSKRSSDHSSKAVTQWLMSVYGRGCTRRCE